ncbi:MAG: VCBS repeat-containing protein [Bryobacteraceae bacterium]
MRLFLILASVCCAFAADLKFKTQTVADDLRGGYHVVVTDMNRDGKPDLIALASGLDELIWYENPTWTRHVIARGLKGMINCAVLGDDIVVAHGFDNDASKSEGIVSVLHRPDDAAGLWTVREIDRLPTSHRLRVAELEGRKIVANAPLTGAAARPPDFKDQVPLVFYRPGEWKREFIDDRNFGVQHGIFVDGGSILTASFAGIHRYAHTRKGWTRTEISKGDPTPCPKCGASDIAVTRDGAIVSIEPWHGNQIVEYRKGRGRKVIDDSLSDTHSITAADLDGDGRDELIVAQRGAPGRVLIYRAGKKMVIDEGITAAMCAAADLDGDGRIDLACIGSGSHNLKVYWNQR